MRYVLRKVVLFVITLWAALTLNFLLPQLIPGNPVQLILARESQSAPVTPGEAASLAEEAVRESELRAQMQDQIQHIKLLQDSEKRYADAKVELIKSLSPDQQKTIRAMENTHEAN